MNGNTNSIYKERSSNAKGQVSSLKHWIKWQIKVWPETKKSIKKNKKKRGRFKELTKLEPIFF